ncbi:hypothetical protein BH09BAC5_BH09BAC5_03210 [soil metagenome]
MPKTIEITEDSNGIKKTTFMWNLLNTKPQWRDWSSEESTQFVKNCWQLHLAVRTPEQIIFSEKIFGKIAKQIFGREKK